MKRSEMINLILDEILCELMTKVDNWQHPLFTHDCDERERQESGSGMRGRE